MKTIACLLAMTALAAAQPTSSERSAAEHEPRLSFGLAGEIAVERNLAYMTSLELGWRLAPRYWLDAAVGIGAAGSIDPAGSGQHDSRALEGRIGVARLACGNRACAGMVGSIGYHHQSIDFVDSLVDPEMWTETRDLGFAEARGVGRLRMLAGRLALEAALAARVYTAFRAEHASGGVNAGVVGSIGLIATL